MAGCSVESGGGGRPNPTDDGGFVAPPPGQPDDDAEPTLTIEGDSVLPLTFGESVELVVVLTRSDGELERGLPVAFDLIGQPEDSSLSALSARTDRDGRASVTLHAGTLPVTFEVQASSGRARPISFSVSVSGNGFGSLLVHAPYRGARAVAERFVFALPGVSCELAQYATGVARTVLPPSEDNASLIALPASLSYAVVAIAAGATGQVVARGCTDEVVVSEQGEHDVSVLFVDQPLVPAEALDLEITLEAGSSAAALGAAMRSAVGELVRASGETAPRDAEGHFWLDALDVALRGDDGDDALLALADALEGERLDPAQGSPENDLAGLLERNDEGARAVASAMAAEVRAALDTVVLHAGVGFENGATPQLEVESLRIEALPVYEGAEAPRVVLDETQASVQIELVPGEDALDITELQLAPGLGALGADALSNALAASGFELGDFAATAGCSSLDAWLTAQPFVAASGCDARCRERAVERACQEAFQQIAETAHDALLAVDEERPLATLRGMLSLTDGDGDLRAEKMKGERIEGSWAPAPDASLGDTLRGTAVATVP